MRHQRVVDQAEAGGRVALDRELIEGVEAAQRPLPDAAALGRVRVHPVEVREVRPVRGRADQRQRVVLGEVVRGRGGRSAKDKHEGERPRLRSYVSRPYRVATPPKGIASAASLARRSSFQTMTGRSTSRQVNPCSFAAQQRSRTSHSRHLNTRPDRIGKLRACSLPRHLLRQRRRAVRQLAQ